MKFLKYRLATVVNTGTVEQPEYKMVLTDVKLPWNEANEAIAKAEAHKGLYTVEDEGTEETLSSTQLDILEAQVIYTAMMTDTLLEV